MKIVRITLDSRAFSEYSINENSYFEIIKSSFPNINFEFYFEASPEDAFTHQYGGYLRLSGSVSSTEINNIIIKMKEAFTSLAKGINSDDYIENKDLTDYDTEQQIKNAATSLGIYISNKKIDDIFAELEEKCSAVTEIILEKTFEKDKLADYIGKHKATITKDEYGRIIVGFDPVLNSFVANDCHLYQLILEAINKCQKS